MLMTVQRSILKPEVQYRTSTKFAMQIMFLTLSPRKAEIPASPTVTNSSKAEIPACRSLIYSRKDEYRLGNCGNNYYK